MFISPIQSLRRQLNPGACCSECARRGTRCKDHAPSYEREENPTLSTLALLVGGAAVAGGIGYIAYKRRHVVGQKLPPAQILADVLKADAILADAGETVVADIMQPIALASTTPTPKGYDKVDSLAVYAPGSNATPAPIMMRNVDFGSGYEGVPNDLMWDGRDMSGAEIAGPAPSDSSQAIGALVTGIVGDVAAVIYERSLAEIGKGEAFNWADPAQRDAATVKILAFAVPGVDYSKGLAPYVYGSPESLLWIGAQTIATVANQSWWNKQAQASAGA